MTPNQNLASKGVMRFWSSQSKHRAWRNGAEAEIRQEGDKPEAQGGPLYPAASFVASLESAL